jgi:hypothetical protein
MGLCVCVVAVAVTWGCVCACVCVCVCLLFVPVFIGSAAIRSDSAPIMDNIFNTFLNYYFQQQSKSSRCNRKSSVLFRSNQRKTCSSAEVISCACCCGEIRSYACRRLSFSVLSCLCQPRVCFGYDLRNPACDHTLQCCCESGIFNYSRPV